MSGYKLVPRVDEAYDYPLLIKHILRTPLTYAPEQEIVYRDQMRYTYRDLWARINRLAGALKALGVGPGDVVGVMDWDSHRYLEAYFAVPMMGAVLHTINVRLSPAQVLWTINHAEDKVVLVHQDFIPLVKAIKDKAQSVEKWVLLAEQEDVDTQGVEFAGTYEQLLSAAPEEYPFPEFDENTMATLFYTTGTTGDPKGVYFSHRQLVLHTLGLAVAFGAFHGQGRFRSNDVYMPLTPMFHVHAWGVPYLATLYGLKQVYPGRYEPEMLLKLLITEKVTFSHCVPTILHMLVSAPQAKQLPIKGWKVVIGGAALPKGLAKAALELGIDVYTGYGMSETCPLLTLALLKPDKMDAPMEEQVEIRTKTGLPAPLVDLKVVDEQMNPVPADGKTTGEIVVRAPWLTQGYYKAPDKGAELWRGGYLHTGDVATWDSEGYVKITDRLKDVIKSGGEWVSSLELESLISQHESVSEVAVIGVPDEKWGERPVALVVPKQGMSIDPEAIKGFLKQFVDQGKISKWAVPEQVIEVSELPKTSVGKIDKKLLRARFAKAD